METVTYPVIYGIEPVAGIFRDIAQGVIPWSKLEARTQNSPIMKLTCQPDCEPLHCNGRAKMWRVHHHGFTFRIKQEPRPDSFLYESEALYRLTMLFIKDARIGCNYETMVRAGFPILGGVDFATNSFIMLEVRGSILDEYLNPNAPALHRFMIGRQLYMRIQQTHNAGISHADFWPDNLLYCPYTQVLSLTDFGSCGLSCDTNSVTSVILGHKKDDNKNGPWCLYRPREVSFCWEFDGHLADRYSLAALYYSLIWGQDKLQRFMVANAYPYINPLNLFRSTVKLIECCEEMELLYAICDDLNPDPTLRKVPIDDLACWFENAIRVRFNI